MKKNEIIAMKDILTFFVLMLQKSPWLGHAHDSHVNTNTYISRDCTSVLHDGADKSL